MDMKVQAEFEADSKERPAAINAVDWPEVQRRLETVTLVFQKSTAPLDQEAQQRAQETFKRIGDDEIRRGARG
jgi:hypothetical protein